MSMSALVADPIPTPIAVQEAARALGFDVRIDEPSIPFDTASGFRPMTFGVPKPIEAGGVEIYIEDAGDFAQEYGLEIDKSFNRVIWFRFGSRFEELYSAQVVCAALARLGGKVFSDEEGTFKTEQEIVAEAQQTLQFIKA